MIFDKITAISNSKNENTDYLIAKKLVQMYLEDNFLSVKELAQDIHVSESLLTVFAKKLDLKGYRELISLLKFERLEQIKPANNRETISQEENLVDLFNFNKSDIDNIFNKILKTRVFILSSNQLRVQTELLNEIFKFNNIDSTLFLNNYLFYEYIKNTNSKDSIIFFFAGQDNDVLFQIYKKISKINKNIFIFCSNSQKYKFDFYDTKIVLDINQKPHNYIYRNIAMSYIIAYFHEAINLLEKN
ncbi:hypothetical protein [Spiroplasma floricola]|uniref:HTH rpiR-type domain-containing protein n=1 Tax=Spiroplasma floricola 23-6 TaxID=1336749 RepID=A0A2K8SE74_9MOLU|nr:hypothetical protein [Spiroplasma floricola]AUB31732.1 hypothetical protein SFLOR_v1c06840 [Spiroplasma floricola 23-6]